MKTKRILANFLAIAMLICMFAASAFAAVDPASTDLLAKLEAADLVILHTNDTHGYVKADRGGNVIGFDYIAGIKDALKNAGKNVILADAGDFSNGQPFAALTKGKSVLEVMIAAGWDVGTIGNHEYDFFGNISDLVAQAKDGGIPIISSNIKNKDGTPVAEPSAVIEIGGIKVGFVGVTTPETEYKASPQNTETTDFGDIDFAIASVKTEAKALRDGGCDIVVVLSHLGTADSDVGATSIVLANALEAGLVDVIIDGHSHTAAAEGDEVNGIWIVSTGGESNSALGVLAFTQNGDDYDVAPSFIDYDTSRALGIEPNAEVTALIDKLYVPVEEMENTIVAKTDVKLNGTRADVRTGETNLGNTLTDAIRVFTGSEIGFTNGGNIRADIEIGDISYGSVFTTLPFGNVVYKANVKGSDIWAAIENGVSLYPDQSGGFPHVSGMSYVFDASKPAGERVVSIEVGGKPIDLDAEYTFATNDYTAAGGDKYTMFKDAFRKPLAYEIPATSDGSMVLCDVLAWYLNEYGPSDVEGRITATGTVITPEPAPAPEPTPAPDASGKTYTVVEGDWLSTIAKANGITWQELYDLNKDTIKDPNRIYPGQTIVLP